MHHPNGLFSKSTRAPSRRNPQGDGWAAYHPNHVSSATSATREEELWADAGQSLAAALAVHGDGI